MILLTMKFTGMLIMLIDLYLKFQKINIDFSRILLKIIYLNFLLENNVLYITDIKKSYAFKLKEDFEIFVDQMYKMNAPVFYISFMVPDCEDIFDFSFMGEV